jgi:hypothetical protein
VNLSVSQPIRILALVGLLAIVGLGSTTMLLGRSHPTTPPAAPAHVRAKKPTAPVAHVSAKPHAAHKTPPVAAAPTKPTAATHHKAATPASPKHQGNLVYADLPTPLQWQLSQHKVVVVSLYNPNANVDAISVAEAHAGAVDAGAGFLLVSVLDNKVAGILTALLPGGGLLPAPGILVYRAPGNIALRIDGFADRTSVAQAAQNAFAGETGPTPTDPTAAVTPATVTP